MSLDSEPPAPNEEPTRLESTLDRLVEVMQRSNELNIAYKEVASHRAVRNSELIREVSRLQTELARRDRRIRELESTLAAAGLRVDELKARLQSAAVRVAELKQRAAAARSKATQLASRDREFRSRRAVRAATAIADRAGAWRRRG